MKAILSQIRITPKKMNLVAALVRRKSVKEAMDILKFTPKKSATPLRKLIASAEANAVNNFKQEKDSLIIKEIIVTGGPTYKRSQSVSKGRAHPILKRTSNIIVKLDVTGGAKKEKKVEKEATTEEKKTTKKTVKKTSVKAKK